MSTAPDSCAISLGELRDIDDVIEVMNAAFDPVFGEAWSKSQLSGLLITPGSWLLLLHIADKTAGFAIARSVLDESELMLLAIAPDFRSRGFGRQLLDAVIHEAKEREARRLFLEMRSDNDAALRLYGKSGFIPVGHRLRYYRGEDGILRDAITMERSLD